MTIGARSADLSCGLARVRPFLLRLFCRPSISTRFFLVLAIGFLFQTGISVVSLIRLRASLMQNRTSEVKHLLETAYTTVAFYHDQAHRGLITDGEARQAARNVLRVMRYDGNNYFFVWSLDGTAIVHGAHPEWEGKRFINSADATANPLVADMVARLLEVARSGQKAGVATYRIPRAGQTIPLDKIAYTRLFVPWGWSIGTGAYVDDVEALFWREGASILLASTGLIILASGLTFFIGRNLARALNRLSAQIVTVAQGELDDEIPEVERSDEVGVMARALLVLRENSREAVDLRLDHLTGLLNRKVLMTRLRLAIDTSARSGHYCGLMIVDIDRFKTLNDSHGHDAGDMLLGEVARRLVACAREGDIVARLGGDEFVVVVVDNGQRVDEAATAVEAVSKKILAALNQPYQLGSILHVCTASVGLTLFKGGSASPDDLLKQADIALYRSKESGRNAFQFFEPHMEATLHERAALEADLRQAIGEKQFVLYYQAQVGSKGEVLGAEALIRWDHPLRGRVSPAEFICLAERSGLILPLGQWVLETACTQLARWALLPETSHLMLAVNVSVRQFQQIDFVEQVLTTLRSTGADPSKLELEMTESLLVEDIEGVIEKMRALKSVGVSFALDDFGTGYSSLSYLKRLPLDHLKIDRSFVRDVLTDPNDAAIATTIVALAQKLGLGVVGEGVETAEQRDFLHSSGCHLYQGYLFSIPLPLEDFEHFNFQLGRDPKASAAGLLWSASPGSVHRPAVSAGSPAGGGSPAPSIRGVAA